MTAGVATNRSMARYLTATGALSVLLLVWFGANLTGPVGPAWFGWLPGPLSLGISTVALADAARSPLLAPAARRFWRHLTLASAVVWLANTAYAGGVLTGLIGKGSAQEIPPPLSALMGVGMMIVLWALLRLPVAERTRSEIRRLVLDGLTVMAGALLFIWYFSLVPMLRASHDSAAVVSMLMVGVITEIALAAVVKVVLGGSGPVESRALRILLLSVLVGAMSSGVAPLITHLPNLSTAQLICAPIGFFDCWAAASQLRAARAGAGLAGPRRARRPYSRLPYLAIAATDVLLGFAVVVRPDARTPVVVAGAIVVTALVAVRQLVAFADNERLLRSLRQHEDRLHHQATHDALTGLANRALLGDRLRTALAGARPGRVPAVLLIDLDDFKIVNDTLGHTVGDALLTAVARRLRGCARQDDTVARLGGDEFALLLVGTTPTSVVEVTGRVLAALGEPFPAGEHSLMVQASIGVAEADPGDDPERLLSKADIAMYAAKEQGKGRYARYTAQMNEALQEQAKIGAQLHGALDRGELRLLYQPIVELPSGRLYAVEALVRWQHGERGLIAPGQFIPAAERTGLIVPLGRWVLTEACRQAVAWHREYPAYPLTVGVNVSGRQLQEPGFADEVAAILAETGLSPARLTIEATETAVLKGGQVLRNLASLRALGIRLALDDFGTGHSSLGLLRTCPVDVLKLDRSFVEELSDTRHRPAVAMAILQMAQVLGLGAVAEGIETAAQADQLHHLGYRLGQGYYFGCPQPASDILARLRGRTDTVPPVLAVGA